MGSSMSNPQDWIVISDKLKIKSARIHDLTRAHLVPVAVGVVFVMGTRGLGDMEEDNTGSQMSKVKKSMLRYNRYAITQRPTSKLDSEGRSISLLERR